MDFTLTERQSYWRDRVRDFIEANVRPNNAEFLRQEHTGERWKVIADCRRNEGEGEGRGNLEPVHAAIVRAQACR